jgi:hypothetical protein
VIELCHLTKDQAAKLLKLLTNKQLLVPSGEKRGAVYHINLDI